MVRVVRVVTVGGDGGQGNNGGKAGQGDQAGHWSVHSQVLQPLLFLVVVFYFVRQW